MAVMEAIRMASVDIISSCLPTAIRVFGPNGFTFFTNAEVTKGLIHRTQTTESVPDISKTNI